MLQAHFTPKLLKAVSHVTPLQAPPKRPNYGTPPRGPPGVSVGIHFSVSGTRHDTFIFCSQRGLPASRPPKVAGQNRAICFQACGWRNQGEMHCVSSWGISRWRLQVYLSISLSDCILFFNLHVFFLLSSKTCTEFICLFPFIQFTHSSEEQRVPCTKPFCSLLMVVIII